MNTSMVLTALSLCSLMLFPPAGASQIYSIDQPDNNVLQPVKVGFAMVRCSILKSRCPRVKMQMSPEVYNSLGKPKDMQWDYTAYGAATKCYSIGGFPSCIYDDLDITSKVKIVYDSGKNQYHALKTGIPNKVGVGYELTSICFFNGKEYNCEKVSLTGNSYKDGYVYKTLYFNTPDSAFKGFTESNDVAQDSS